MNCSRILEKVISWLAILLGTALLWMFWPADALAALPLPPGHVILVDDDFADVDTDGVCDDCGDVTRFFSKVATAIENAACGMTVLVRPGHYDEQVSFQYGYAGSFDCPEDAPLVIKAEKPAVAVWNEDKIGAGPLRGCDTGSCDETLVSYVRQFNTWRSVTNANIHIVGFVTHEIFFTPTMDDYSNPDFFGCRDCKILRNYFFVNYRNCIRVTYSDDIEIAGNHLYRCGGNDSGDPSLKTDTKAHSHHNDIYGSGLPNGDESTCNASDFSGCQGTDGFTVHDTYYQTCGSEFDHNRIRDMRVNAEDTSDGDCIDLKIADCADDAEDPSDDGVVPISIHDNEISGCEATQVIFHAGVSGVDFYNNMIHGGLDGGVVFQAGQECDGSSGDAGDMNDFVIHDNVITGNASIGLNLKHIGSGTCAEDDKRSITDVKIFNNTIADNGSYGLVISWVHDADCEDGSCSRLEGVPEDTILVYNNILQQDEGEALRVQDKYLDYVDFRSNVVAGARVIVNTDGVTDDYFDSEDFLSVNSTIAVEFVAIGSREFLLDRSQTQVVNAGIAWENFVDGSRADEIGSIDIYGMPRTWGESIDIGAVEAR